MNSTRPAGRGVLLAVAGGGLALGLVLHAGGASDDPPAPIRFPRDEVRVAETIGGAQPRSLPERRPDVLPAEPVAARTAPPVPDLGEPPVPRAVEPERLAAALEELGTILEAEPFRRSDWESGLRAHAASFGRESAAVLPGVLTDGECSDGALLAGLELAGLWSVGATEVPEAALSRARALGAVLSEHTSDAPTLVAARVAAGFGDERAAAAAAELLLFSRESDVLEAGRWILAGARSESAAQRLASEVPRLEAGSRLVLVLRALAEMRDDDGAPILSEPARFGVARGAAVLLTAPETELEAATGVLAALEAFAPDAVRDVLFDCVDSPRRELSDHALDRLVATADEEVLERLGTRLLGEPDPALAARFARALLPAERAGDLPTEVSDVVGSALRSEALRSEDARARRRAVHALGGLADEASAGALAEVVVADEREQVRVAAVAALGRHPGAKAHLAALRLAAEEDPSKVVRRTAANVLRRFAPEETVARRTDEASLLQDPPGRE